MNDNDVHDTLTAAYDDIVLSDPVTDVMRRGNRIRSARRASRATYVGMAALTAVSLGVVATSPSPNGGSGPIRLVAYSLPSLPVALNPVPAGLAVSFDYDISGDGDGDSTHRLIAFYDRSDADNRTDLSLRVLDDAAEDPEATDDADVTVQGKPGRLFLRDLPGTADDQATVTWEAQKGSWASLTGRGEFSTEASVLAQAENVRNEPLPLNMRLDFAPAGWDLAGYKVISPGGAVLAMTEGGTSDGSARRLTVALYTRAYTSLVPAQMEDPGPITPVDLAGRTGELMEGSRGWFLQVPLDDSTYITLQAPKDLSRDQVIQMAEGIGRN